MKKDLALSESTNQKLLIQKKILEDRNNDLSYSLVKVEELEKVKSNAEMQKLRNYKKL